LTAFPEKHPGAQNVHVSAAEAAGSAGSKSEGIVFLHQIEPGPASRSYGVQVARLAGMPAPLIRQARGALEALETNSSAQQAQVDLFAAPPAAPTVEPSALDRAVDALEPDTLSPREALDALYRLKELRKEAAS
jgi:DNA mismatch repair protein MutS